MTYLPRAVLNRRVKGYSHGERTRLALMMALNSDSELVILDEPTNGLDRESMYQLREDIRSMAHQTTFLLTGHNLEFYADFADQVFVLTNGNVEFLLTSGSSTGRSDALVRAYDKHFPTVRE